MTTALALGLIAGALTTVAGIGGGQVLLIGLTTLWDPVAALTITGPALLVGNGHRLLLFRAHLKRAVVQPYVLGAIPGSLLGGWLAVSVPLGLLNVAMVGMAALAAARSVFGWRVEAPPAAIAPAGAVIGAVAATGGGAGVLAGPLLLATGLTGPSYIAAGAAGAMGMHLGRMTAYSASGWVTASTIGTGLLLAVAIMAGNALGVRLRSHIQPTWTGPIEVGAVWICLILALINLTGS